MIKANASRKRWRSKSVERKMNNETVAVTAENNMETKMSPPWIIYYEELKELFKRDPEVEVKFNRENYVISIYVETSAKGEALAILLPQEKRFGNVLVKTKIIQANKDKDIVSLFRKIFEGNGAVKSIESNNGITHVVFDNKVVQYYSDNTGDINGNTNTLYQDIANRIFTVPYSGVFFCTYDPTKIPFQF